jgi:hypothetical protein
VVEGARLESVFRGNSNVGSNPTLSASLFGNPFGSVRSLRRETRETGTPIILALTVHEPQKTLRSGPKTWTVGLRMTTLRASAFEA